MKHYRVNKGLVIVCLALFAVSPASFAGTAPLSVTPDCPWLYVPPSDPSQCNYDPDNPQETNFVEVSTPEGPGIMLSTGSYTAEHCGCTRRDQYFSLPCGTLNTTADNPHLRGWYSPTRGSSDPFSVASMIVALYNGGPQGRQVGSVTYVAEIRPNNNCSCFSFGPQRLLSPGSFDIPLSSIAPNVDFDTVAIRLTGYGCGVASNSITVANLRIVY